MHEGHRARRQLRMRETCDICAANLHRPIGKIGHLVGEIGQRIIHICAKYICTCQGNSTAFIQGNRLIARYRRRIVYRFDCCRDCDCRRGCAIVLVFYGVLTGMEPPVFRATVAMFVFLAVFFIGFMYEWKKGALEWR